MKCGTGAQSPEKTGKKGSRRNVRDRLSVPRPRITKREKNDLGEKVKKLQEGGSYLLREGGKLENTRKNKERKTGVRRGEKILEKNWG